jgi:hypothetical protein
MPPPVAQPHDAVNSIAGLLMNWNQRKSKGEEAEAANIAQNLVQAIRNNDKDTINDILNNDHSKKILNKVYKGWLTKMEQAQKPGKEPDPTVSGFEAGIQKATQGGQQPQQPQSKMPMPQQQSQGGVGGVRLPMSTQQDQLGAARVSAETQASKQDPSRLLAGDPKTQAEMAKAAAEVQKAQLEVQKYELELKTKQQEAASSEARGKAALAATEARGKFATDIEHEKYLTSLVNLDIAKQRFRNTVQAKAGKQKQLPISDRIKIESVDKAISIVEGVLKDKRGFSVSDITSLSNELKAAGSTELIKRLPSEYTTWLHGKGTVDDFAAALNHYKESLKKAFDDGYPGWDGSAPDKKAKTASGEQVDDESDDVDADIIVNPEDLEEPAKKP